MRWSFRIARVAGIDIRVHLTFLLIVFLGAGQFGRYGVGGALFGVAVILLLFLCVTLHELGHSVVAQKFGIPVKQIILLPIGGVAMLSRMPNKPSQELWIAIAGPLVNVVIAAALLAGIGANFALGRLDMGAVTQALRSPPSGTLMLVILLQANIFLVLFNLIPAFPLDGGRMLRAILAMNMPAVRATRIAATVGQFLAVLFGMLGLFTGNFLWVIIAIFIFFGAGAETAEGYARTVLATHRVGDAYNRHAITLDPDERLSTVIHYILTSYQPDFAVARGRQVLGVVTREDVMRVLAEAASAGGGSGAGAVAAAPPEVRDVPVGVIMKPEPLRVPARATLEEVRQAMADRGTRVAAVYDGTTYLGLVSAEDIAEAYAVLRYVDGARPQAAQQAAPVGAAPERPGEPGEVVV